jgi:hypothetical protein
VPEIPYIPGGLPGRPLPPQFGPRPDALSRPEIDRQIEALTARLVRRVQNLGLGVVNGVLEVEQAAQTLAAMMAGAPPARARAATIIAETLLDVDERESPDFWGTDLGAAMAREIGFCHPNPTRQVAAAVLRVTRSAVGQMVQRGVLVGTDAGVTHLSLQEAALTRWPRESDLDGAEA